MNPITKALSDIKFRIPKPILEDAFKPRHALGGMFRNSAQSLDFHIRQQVIDARVMEDCNLVGGAEARIYIGDIQPEYLPQFRMIWRIPLSKTQNRAITKAYSLGMGFGGFVGKLASPTGSSLQAAANDLLDNNRVSGSTIDTEIELVGRNTIMSYQEMTPVPDLFLNCVIENDAEFNNLPASAIPKFTKLVEYAVKSYIYNTMVLEVGEAELRGGASLGQYNSIIEGYADAEENYQDYFLNHWRKIAYMADPTARQRHLRRVLGGRHG